MNKKFTVEALGQEWESVKLTQESVDELKLKLGKKFPKEKVDIFLLHLHLKCAFYYTLCEHPDSSIITEKKEIKHRKSLKLALKGFKNALKHLEAIKNLESPYNTLDPVVAKYVKGCAAQIIYQALDPTIKALQEDRIKLHPRKGRPSLYKGLIADIAELFVEHLGKPTSTKDGLFNLVVRTAISTVDSSDKESTDYDLSRTIKSVLKKLAESDKIE
ncbi:hypothetical protein ACFL5K_01345 [Gemmatimonadota bacterium]